MGKFTADPSCQAKMHQYQIVGRAAPTAKNPVPKIYRMRLFAKNTVLAKSRFWYFMKRLNKAKRSGGAHREEPGAQDLQDAFVREEHRAREVPVLVLHEEVEQGQEERRRPPRRTRCPRFTGCVCSRRTPC